jgi:hypothetical protein
MIHHVSLPAHEPRHVAEVLAELMCGRCLPFAPREGAFMALSGDTHGSLIEVYPEGTGLAMPSDDGQVVFTDGEPLPGHWPFHLLLSVPLDEEAVARIGSRNRWRTKTLGRGPAASEPRFHVIEFWIENRLMVEIATPPMARQYVSFLDTLKHEKAA